jgi:hypothetical protein
MLLAAAIPAVLVAGTAWACAPQGGAIDFDSLEYFPGDEVTVSGRSFPRDEPVELTLQSPSGALTPVGNGVSTEDGGTFEDSFTLSSSAELGTYVVSAETETTGSAPKTFEVVARPVSESDPAPSPPLPPAPLGPAPGSALGAPDPGVVGAVFPAKIEVERARVMRRDLRLDVLTPITGRASGEVEVEFFAAQRRLEFTEEVDSGNRRVRFDRAIPAEQARLGTGIMTIAYPGDEDTRPQEVRLRAASQKASLALERPRIDAGRLKAQGTISDRARGIVRLQLQYVVDGQTETVELRGRIDDGRWEIDEALSQEVRYGIARRTGTVHSYTLFTGYFERRIRGEMRAFEILGDR